MICWRNFPWKSKLELRPTVPQKVQSPRASRHTSPQRPRVWTSLTWAGFCRQREEKESVGIDGEEKKVTDVGVTQLY